MSMLALKPITNSSESSYHPTEPPVNQSVLHFEGGFGHASPYRQVGSGVGTTRNALIAAAITSGFGYPTVPSANPPNETSPESYEVVFKQWREKVHELLASAEASWQNRYRINYLKLTERSHQSCN